MFNIQDYNKKKVGELKSYLEKASTKINIYYMVSEKGISDFLTQSHTQLLKEFLESEVERLEKVKVNYIWDNGVCDNCGFEGLLSSSHECGLKNELLDDQITHYQSLLSTLGDN